MMFMLARTFRFRPLGAVLALTALSGCFLNPDALPPNETVPLHQLYHSMIRLQPALVKPQAETITMIHRTNFGFGQDGLSESEAARLAVFLQDSGADRKTRIEIDGPRKAAGKHDILTAARIATIAERLSDMGLTASVAARPIESLAKAEDAIVVTVTRAMIIEPDCAVPKTIYGPRPTHVWSCSSAVALGRMVADPLDLERGRPQGPGDAEALAPGVGRYRAGKVTPLKAQEAAASE